MSVLNQSGEEQVECPLCMEPLEVDDLHFYPCTCGYQICRFCWNRIRETENGLCPACRKAYPENPADFTPLSQEQVAAIKTEKKAREQKKRNKTLESRRALANVRVVQNNLVFVVGLPVRLADPEILKRQEYFGKYGKIHKVVINQSTTYAGSQGPSASAYVTYVSGSDALRAIQGVNNVTLDGRVLKGSLGTTKYCANFMKNQPCPKADCMYLHELGDPKASFTKEEMHQGLHQVYERKLHNQLIASQRDKPTDSIINATGNPSTNGEKSSSKDGNNSNFITTTAVTSSNINVVNSNKSKKECMNGNGGTSSSGSSTSGKEAWPSLNNAQTDNIHTVNKSQENGTPESSSPTQQTQQHTAQTKNSKENYTETSKSRNKDSNTNGQSKKNKSDSKKHKNSNSINSNSDETETGIESKALNSNNTASVFENDKNNSYLSNELDELESDRHSLLENYDLLDNSDHSLLEDDTHNLLDDAASEPVIMQNNREMLSGLVDNNHLHPHLKSPLVNGFGLLDRDVLSYIGNDRPVSQTNQGHIDQKELLLRERSRSEMLMRQNELLARQHNIMVEPKRFMPSSSIGLESASELLGANFHPNPNMLPPFGMRIENSIANSMAANSYSASSLSANALGGNTMSVNSLGGNNMSVNTMGGNTISMNSLGGNSISVNHMGNNLGGNTMSVNSLGGNTMSANVMGGNSHAMGVNSHILGMNSQTMGGNSHTMGGNSHTMGGNSHTMGGNSHSMGGNSHSMGGNSHSMGGNSHSMGGNSHSMGGNSHSMGGNSHSMGGNSHSMGGNSHSMSGNSLAGSSMGGFMLHNQQLLQNQQHMQQSGLVNGLDSQSSEGRYLAENMDKFFTDFHKAQQRKLVLIGQNEDRRYQQQTPHNMLTVNSLEMDHKQRLNNMRGSEVGGGRAAGDGDDDLDFDPFKETQKALAEMMETEMMQNSVSSGDNMDRVRRSRLAPPGFAHVNAFNQTRPHHMHQGYNTNSATFSDWTQMDPAIMSTSVNTNKPAPTPPGHHDVLARFNQLQLQASWGHKPWTYPNIPLPPGFAPPKTSQHPPECIDAK